jgi:hypothetical protein
VVVEVEDDVVVAREDVVGPKLVVVLAVVVVLAAPVVGTVGTGPVVVDVGIVGATGDGAQAVRTRAKRVLRSLAPRPLDVTGSVPGPSTG